MFGIETMHINDLINRMVFIILSISFWRNSKLGKSSGNFNEFGGNRNSRKLSTLLFLNKKPSEIFGPLKERFLAFFITWPHNMFYHFVA